MIYRIVCCSGDGAGIDIYGPDAEMAVLNPHLEIELNSAGSLEFTLPVENENWNVPNVFQNEIEVWEDDKIIWFGRPLQIVRDWNNQRRVVCEGALSYFNDTIQRTWEQQPATNKTNISFFKHLVNIHNNDTQNNKHFTYSDSTITIESIPAYRKTDYDTTLDCLQNMCLATDGGFFILRKEYTYDPTEMKDVATRYIDWYETLPENAMQDVQFGINLLDISQDLNGADICTVLIVSGKDDVMLNELGNKNPANNDGVGHNSGSDEIYYQPGIETYGRIIQQKSWNDYSDINELWRKAKEWMIEKNTDIPTIECSAADLYYINDPDMVVDGPLQVGMKVNVVSAPHDFNKQLLMYKISMDLDSGVKKVTLGTPPKKELTDIVAPSSGGSSTTSGKGAAGGSSESGSGSGGGSQTVIAPVQDVKVKWPDTDVYTSVVKKKVAKIDLTEVGKVLDVLLNGVSVVDNKVAKINIERILCGTAVPTSLIGKNGDVYLEIDEGDPDPQPIDLFGTPESDTTETGIITENTGATVYRDYYPYKAFGNNAGGGRNSMGNYILTYMFTNGMAYKPTYVKFCNNFTVTGGWLQSKVTFQGSNDGSTWTDIVSKNEAVTRDTYFEANLLTNNYYKYFRFNCSGITGNYTGIKGIVVNGIPFTSGEPGIKNIYTKNDGSWLKYIKDITDVKVNDETVVTDHVANISVPVLDVVDPDGSSLVDNNKDAIIPVIDIVDSNNHSLVDEHGIAEIDGSSFITVNTAQGFRIDSNRGIEYAHEFIKDLYINKSSTHYHTTNPNNYAMNINLNFLNGRNTRIRKSAAFDETTLSGDDVYSTNLIVDAVSPTDPDILQELYDISSYTPYYSSPPNEEAKEKLEFIIPSNGIYGIQMLAMSAKNPKYDTKVLINSNRYTVVIPVGTENPSEEGWFEHITDSSIFADYYRFSTDTSVNSSKTYYKLGTGSFFTRNDGDSNDGHYSFFSIFPLQTGEKVIFDWDRDIDAGDGQILRSVFKINNVDVYQLSVLSEDTIITYTGQSSYNVYTDYGEKLILALESFVNVVNDEHHSVKGVGLSNNFVGFPYQGSSEQITPYLSLGVTHDKEADVLEQQLSDGILYAIDNNPDTYQSVRITQNLTQYESGGPLDFLAARYVLAFPPYRPSGSGVVNVEANPTGTPSANLTKLKVDHDIYKVSSIEANPQGTAVGPLNKIGIDGNIFNVAGGSGNFAIYTLYNRTTYPTSSSGSNQVRTYTFGQELSPAGGSFDDYDAIYVMAWGYWNKNSGYEGAGGILIFKDDFYKTLTTSPNQPWSYFINSSYTGGTRLLWFTLINSTTLKSVSESTETGNEPIIFKIFGITF